MALSGLGRLLARRRPEARRICGVCLIRDSVDLVPMLCGHYLRIGFDRLVFVDDSSTDGTHEALQAVMRADPRVVVRRSADPVLRQARIVSDAANEALAEGYGIVFPFDADEFWDIDAGRIRAAADRPGLFVGRWVQFVQDRAVGASSREGLLRARHRAPVLAGSGPEAVMRQDGSFVCLTASKVGFRADGPVDVALGQHALARGPGRVLRDDLEVFHLPLRSVDSIRRRAEQAARVLAASRPEQNWQSRFFGEALAEGRLDAAWAAHSASPDGFLDLPGRRIPLIPDARLHGLLSEALAHMRGIHGTVLAAMPEVSVPG